MYLTFSQLKMTFNSLIDSASCYKNYIYTILTKSSLLRQNGQGNSNDTKQLHLTTKQPVSMLSSLRDTNDKHFSKLQYHRL